MCACKALAQRRAGWGSAWWLVRQPFAAARCTWPSLLSWSLCTSCCPLCPLYTTLWPQYIAHCPLPTVHCPQHTAPCPQHTHARQRVDMPTLPTVHSCQATCWHANPALTLYMPRGVSPAFALALTKPLINPRSYVLHQRGFPSDQHGMPNARTPHHSEAISNQPGRASTSCWSGTGDAEGARVWDTAHVLPLHTA